MEILNKNSIFPKDVSLILGFFDGIHLGHCKVIESIMHTKKSVLVTFTTSPAEFFNKKTEYIYPRNFSYNLLESKGIDYILEYDFSEVVNLPAEEYLKDLIENFNPASITTGFNHSFGANKSGDSSFLKTKQADFGYKYFCVPEYKHNGYPVSSTNIKKLLSNGEIELANSLLGRNFSITSRVEEGARLGREIGFPTANLIYPENIVRIPHGVYVAKVLNKPAISNWGVKPTVGSDKEVVEVHIPNFTGNLYSKDLNIEIIRKIRDEKKFNNIEELKLQICEDVEQCLKL